MIKIISGNRPKIERRVHQIAISETEYNLILATPDLYLPEMMKLGGVPDEARQTFIGPVDRHLKDQIYIHWEWWEISLA